MDDVQMAKMYEEMQSLVYFQKIFIFLISKLFYEQIAGVNAVVDKLPDQKEDGYSFNFDNTTILPPNLKFEEVVKADDEDRDDDDEVPENEKIV